MSDAPVHNAAPLSNPDGTPGSPQIGSPQPGSIHADNVQADRLFASPGAAEPRPSVLADDLPYMNEVDAALSRKPRAGAVWLSLCVGLFFLTMLGWAAMAEIDEVTHAEGQIIPSQRTQIIQNLEGGILRSILVHEGQVVNKGDALAQLDNETAVSTLRDAMGKALDNALAIVRLEAEMAAMNAAADVPVVAPAWPQDLTPWLATVLGSMPGPDVLPAVLEQAEAALESQRALFAARSRQMEQEQGILESQWRQRRQEVEELRRRLAGLSAESATAAEQRDIAAQLYGRGNFSRSELLNARQRYQQLSTEISGLEQNIPRAEAAAREAEQRMGFRRAEMAAAMAEEVGKRRRELASLRETLSAGGDRVTRTELRSPVRGTVKHIGITTLGGVVKPGESIMDIVPLDDALLVEARVRPADVAFLHPGQTAMVKISAYDFSIYGGLAGKLEQISADTLEDRRGDVFYLVKVRTEGTVIVHHGTELPIMPGMVATVDILTGKKTVLDYILKPILKARQKALRER